MFCTSSWVTPSTRSTRGPRTRSRWRCASARRSTSTRTSSARPRASRCPRRPSRRRPTIRSSFGSGCKTSSRRTSRSSTRPERAGPVRVALFTNNYLPFCGGVTTSVETLRAGLEAAGHEAWVFGPRFATGGEAGPRVVRYAALPAATYPEFALAVPYSRRVAALVATLGFDVFHAHHPFLLGPAARRLARRQGRPLVFTYHTRYEKYAHYVPLRRPWVEALAVRLPTRFAARADAVLP